MSTSKPHQLRNTIAVALFLLGIGTLTVIYLNESGPYDRGRHAETTISSSLPRWSVSISRELNERVLQSVFEVFDPSLRSFLSSVPIVLDTSADTAKAYPEKGYIGVSPDWDNTVSRSQYRKIYEQRGMLPKDSVFMHRFKTDLLIHEFLHMLQVRQGIDNRVFYDAVSRWYKDRRYGIPSPNGMDHAGMTKKRRNGAIALNRTKYIVWYELYNHRSLIDVPRDESWKDMHYGQRYQLAENGVEEFAYIGQEILASGSGSASYIKTGQWSDKDWLNKKMRLREISPEVITMFRGVFNPVLIQ